MEILRPFQKQFIRGALAPGIDTAALSIPRGNGKSWLAAHILRRCLTPGDALHVPGAEYLLCAASIEQARLVFRFVRADLEPNGHYRFLDASTRIGIADKRDNTRLRVLSSNSKTAMGIVGTPLLVADEPGSWENLGGSLMFDAIQTAMGKPNSPLRSVYIGTLAPSMNGWWHDLVAGGSDATTYVQKLTGDPARWDQWPEIRRCNPLTSISASFRRKLLDERDKGKRDTRLRARFLSYRLNCPSADEASTLLTVADFETMCKRPVPPRLGKPIIGLDLGAGRAWSAAVAIYRNGLVECRALSPGIPSLEMQERRDLVAVGSYRRLASAGVLLTSDGLRVPPVELVVAMVKAAWGPPAAIVCDRFRLPELQDAGAGCNLVPRISRWSESTADIRALRSAVLDGPFTLAVDSRELMGASLSVSLVRNDDAGNTRLIKKGTNNCSRDDVAAAWILAAGLFDRTAPEPKKGRPRSTVVKR